MDSFISIFQGIAVLGGRLPVTIGNIYFSWKTVVAVGFEFVLEKNADPAKFCILVKQICVMHLDK
jgi:hypothetical protein